MTLATSTPLSPLLTPTVLSHVRLWVSRLSQESALFRPRLPLSNAFLQPAYLDQATKEKVAAQVKEQLQAFPKEEGQYYVYTLHDPTVGDTTTPFHLLCPVLDRHTRFKVFLSSLFYVGHGKDERDGVHLSHDYKTGLVGGNPRKQDRINSITDKGAAVYIHRFAAGVTKEQARLLEALILRATRLQGNVTNLKEEKVRVPEGGKETSPFGQQLGGTMVLWEASLTLGRERREVGRAGGQGDPRWLLTNNHKQRMSVRNAKFADEKHLRMKFTRVHDLAILQFIQATKSYSCVLGCKVWQAMVQAGGRLAGRKYTGLRQRFLNRIIKCINTYGLPQDEVNKFVLGHANPATVDFGRLSKAPKKGAGRPRTRFYPVVHS